MTPPVYATVSAFPRYWWQEAIAVIAYPASFLFAVTAFLWASTNGYPKWVSAYLPVIVCAAIVLPALERISPHRLDWRPSSREWLTDALYTFVIQIAMPPLRARIEDVPEFVQVFAAKHAGRMGRRVTGAEPAFVEALTGYRWPGNIRELENVVERAVALSTGELLQHDSLPAEVTGPAPVGAGERPRLAASMDLEQYLEEERRRYMTAALDQAGGIQTRAAERLGMTFRSFRYFAKKFGLTGREAGGAEDGEAETAAPEPLETPAGRG